jgi:hypothetical protein
MRLVPEDLRADFDCLHGSGIAAIDAALLARLGRDLRSMYEDALEPVPSELSALVAHFSDQDHRRPATPNPAAG